MSALLYIHYGIRLGPDRDAILSKLSPFFIENDGLSDIVSDILSTGEIIKDYGDNEQSFAVRKRLLFFEDSMRLGKMSKLLKKAQKNRKKWHKKWVKQFPSEDLANKIIDLFETPFTFTVELDYIE